MKTKFYFLVISFLAICSVCLPACDNDEKGDVTTPLCLCTLWMVSNHPEGTFERLRYPFGGDRPSQTPHLTLSHHRITVAG